MTADADQFLLPISRLDTLEISAATIIALEDVVISITTRRGVVAAKRAAHTQFAFMGWHTVRTQQIAGLPGISRQSIVRDLTPECVTAIAS